MRCSSLQLFLCLRGTCEVQNFDANVNPCQEWLDVSAPIFLPDTTQLLSLAVQVQIVLSVVDSFGENQCNNVFKV